MHVFRIVCPVDVIALPVCAMTAAVLGYEPCRHFVCSRLGNDNLYLGDGNGTGCAIPFAVDFYLSPETTWHLFFVFMYLFLSLVSMFIMYVCSCCTF